MSKKERRIRKRTCTSCVRPAAPFRKKCYRCIKSDWRAGNKTPAGDRSGRIGVLIRKVDRFAASKRKARDRALLADAAIYFTLGSPLSGMRKLLGSKLGRRARG